MSWQNLGEKLPKSGNFLTRMIGRLMLKTLGWRIDGEFPDRSKAIVALVPHSSNIDFLITFIFNIILVLFVIFVELTYTCSLSIHKSRAYGAAQHSKVL